MILNSYFINGKKGSNEINASFNNYRIDFVLNRSNLNVRIENNNKITTYNRDPYLFETENFTSNKFYNFVGKKNHFFLTFLNIVNKEYKNNENVKVNDEYIK